MMKALSLAVALLLASCDAVQDVSREIAGPVKPCLPTADEPRCSR